MLEKQIGEGSFGKGSGVFFRDLRLADAAQRRLALFVTRHSLRGLCRWRAAWRALQRCYSRRCPAIRSHDGSMSTGASDKTADLKLRKKHPLFCARLTLETGGREDSAQAEL